MRNLFDRLGLVSAVCLSVAFGAAPVSAGALSYVSGTGRDAGDCSSTASPCRTLQYALEQTTANGEIRALDPANYNSLAINKSITITGVAGAGIMRGSAGDAISIDAEYSVVSLSHFDLNGLGNATNGIRIARAGEVKVIDCVIRQFANAGVSARTQAPTILKLALAETEVSDNGRAIDLAPSTGAFIFAGIDRTVLARNANGLSADLLTTAIVTNSAAFKNAGFGFRATNGATMRLGRNVISGNGIGVDVAQGAATVSYRDNNIDGNTTDLSNPMTTSPMK